MIKIYIEAYKEAFSYLKPFIDGVFIGVCLGFYVLTFGTVDLSKGRYL